VTGRLTFAAAAGLGLLLTSCFRATVHSGLPPGDAPDPYENRWHSAWLLGSVEASGPYPLREICPHGWAEVHSSTNLLQGLLTGVTYGIYSPQNVTIVCAAAGAPGPPPRAGYPPPPPPQSSAYPSPAASGYPPPPPRHYDF
jgi:hypothetical protein